MNLNVKQALALKKAEEGHNLLILGQSGTGKSYAIREIERKLKLSGKSVSVTGTTGVASLNVGGITVHSWSGIGDGHFTNTALLKKLLTDEHFEKYKINLQKTDVLIIDEISMLSAKLFTQIEYVAREIRQNDLYFGGIQVIASGDFLQLPPVPDKLNYDSGDFCFKSTVFNSVFRHKLILDEVVRQDETDFVKAINDVALGNLPTDTCNLLKRLSRPLPPGPEPLRLFARNFDRDMFNAAKLLDLDGDLMTFQSVDKGDQSKLKKLSVNQIHHLKIGCPVMLVKNLSKNLVNGLQGIVRKIDMSTKTVTVKFNNDKPETFTVFSSQENKIIASRQQIPLVLSFGISIHKAQGLTLDRVEVDCSNIFKAGQLGGAIGRATKKKGLRLLNFHPRYVIKHENFMLEFYEKMSFEFQENLECCKISYSVETELLGEYDTDKESESELSDFDYEELSEMDRLIETEENPNVSTTSELNEATVETNTPPCPITLEDIKSCIPEIVVTNEQKIVQQTLSNLINERIKLQEFISNLLTELNSIYEKIFEDKVKDAKTWTQYTSEIYKFSTSTEYNKMTEICLKRKPNQEEFTAFGRIFDYVSHYVLETKTKDVRISAEEVPMPQNQFAYDDANLGKLRYIAGRCVAKSKHHFMTSVQMNMYKKNKQELVSNSYLKVKVLDYFTTSYAELSQESIYKESLTETMRKQNITQGLTNIKDDLLEFFISLDKCRLNIQNEKMFHLHGGNIFTVTHEKLLKDCSLFSAFNNLLEHFDSQSSFLRPIDTETAKTALQELFSDIVSRYCKVADNQFRKNLMKSFGKMKSESLRKKVVEAKTSAVVKQISMDYIMDDKSKDKISSHLKMQSSICDHGSSVFKNFTKKQLITLSMAYGLNLSARLDKTKICDELLKTIPTVTVIPNLSALGMLSNTQSTDIPHVNVDEQCPSTSGMTDNRQSSQVKQKRGRKRKQTFTTKKKTSTRKTTESEDKTVCSYCGKLYDSDDQWIQCDLCDMWFDRQCQDISEEQFENMGEDDWYCKKCCE